MKILFLTDNFPPEVNAPATRTFEHCREWVKQGVEVTVITGAPNFPQGKVYPGYSNKLIAKEIIEGINVIRVWTYITSNNGFLKRIVDYFSFASTAFIAGLFVKTDLIIATSPQFFTAIAGRWLHAVKRKPWIMEVRDLWPESIIAVGAMKRGRVIRFLEKVELNLYKSASKIIVVTDAFKEKIASRGINPAKIFVHKNGVILDQFYPLPKDQELLATYNLEGKKVFGYVGTHGMAHGLSFILRTLPTLAEQIPEAHFLFLGDGAEKQNLIALSQELKLTNATFISSVPKQDVIRYLSLLDVSLVNLVKSETFTTVIPSKIFEAAAMQIPILLGLEGEAKGIIESYNAGLCFEPENQDAFIAACKAILVPEQYTDLQKGCVSLSQAFNRRQIALDMIKTISSL
jgi:glycosyltransferase involved in cell wall biosynthesis